MRLTAKQKTELVESLKRALSFLPDDHSCFSCDYFREGSPFEQRPPICAYWDNEPIPDGTLEQGCEEWKDEGVPF